MSIDQTEHPAMPGADPQITADELNFSACFKAETERSVIAINTHMAAATTLQHGHWAAFHAVVHSTDYGTEEKEVLERGTKLCRNLAEELFPQFKHLQYEWQ